MKVWSWYKNKPLYMKVLYVVLAFFVLLGAPAFIESARHSDDDARPATNTATVPSVHRTPIVDEVTLHAYDLLKNPYTHKNHIIALSIASWPIIYNGQVMDYTDAHDASAIQLGYAGLHFERMLSEDTALYNVMGARADSSTSDLELLGQLAVQVPANTQLETMRFWDVEPLGAVEGTNALGGKVTIPLVRFWRYSDQRYASKPRMVGTTSRPGQ